MSALKDTRSVLARARWLVKFKTNGFTPQDFWGYCFVFPVLSVSFEDVHMGEFRSACPDLLSSHFPQPVGTDTLMFQTTSGCRVDVDACSRHVSRVLLSPAPPLGFSAPATSASISVMYSPAS
ncbi:unnamed protein product [Pleuronectes platessa]|uniref:Uncharacterized protein n=1 Tax=Pleuronectes platessa TaxID=8262 RepID=A0A9N7VSW3_PLEPL|nr:unnamed protein product [Pleuronectes platessa]